MKTDFLCFHGYLPPILYERGAVAGVMDLWVGFWENYWRKIEVRHYKMENEYVENFDADVSLRHRERGR